MTGLKILAITPFLGSGFIVALSSVSELEFVQYGALGLCGLVVWFLCKYLARLTQQHEVERKELVESLKQVTDMLFKVVEKNIRSRDSLAEALSNVKCLQDDYRLRRDVQEDGG